MKQWTPPRDYTHEEVRDLLLSAPTTNLGIAERFMSMPRDVVKTIDLEKRLKAFNALMEDDPTGERWYFTHLCRSVREAREQFHSKFWRDMGGLQ